MRKQAIIYNGVFGLSGQEAEEASFQALSEQKAVVEREKLEIIKVFSDISPATFDPNNKDFKEMMAFVNKHHQTAPEKLKAILNISGPNSAEDTKKLMQAYGEEVG